MVYGKEEYGIEMEQGKIKHRVKQYSAKDGHSALQRKMSWKCSSGVGS